MSAPESKVFHKFCSNLPSSKYVFRSGKVANFVRGQYLTTIQSEIDELNNEIELGHPHISIDPKEKTVDSMHADPLAKIKKQAIEEYIAAQAAAIDPSNDMGNTSAAPNAGLVTSRGVSAIAMPPKTK